MRTTCEKCGGKLVIEYFGEYGDIYRVKKDGEPSKQRIKRKIYGTDEGKEPLIYCENCNAIVEQMNGEEE